MNYNISNQSYNVTKNYSLSKPINLKNLLDKYSLLQKSSYCYNLKIMITKNNDTQIGFYLNPELYRLYYYRDKALFRKLLKQIGFFLWIIPNLQYITIFSLQYLTNGAIYIIRFMRLLRFTIFLVQYYLSVSFYSKDSITL